jgi:hypothetical protein
VEAAAVVEEVREVLHILDTECVPGGDVIGFAFAIACVAPAMRAARDDSSVFVEFFGWHAHVDAYLVFANARALAVLTVVPWKACEHLIVTSHVSRSATRLNLVAENCGKLCRAVFIEPVTIVGVAFHVAT